MIRLLVLCTHNSARSQMAEGWLRHLCLQAAVDAEICSAGTAKTRVKPEAAEVMAEVGIDLTQHWSKTIDEVPRPEAFDAVITVCDSANQNCPYFPAARRYHVSLPDPSGQGLERWRQSREQIERVMLVLTRALGAQQWPDPATLNDAR